MITWTKEAHARYIAQCTTEHLLDAYRQLPSIEVRDELERRGVDLWAHGLARIES